MKISSVKTCCYMLFMAFVTGASHAAAPVDRCGCWYHGYSSTLEAGQMALGAGEEARAQPPVESCKDFAGAWNDGADNALARLEKRFHQDICPWAKPDHEPAGHRDNTPRQADLAPSPAR